MGSRAQLTLDLHIKQRAVLYYTTVPAEWRSGIPPHAGPEVLRCIVLQYLRWSRFTGQTRVNQTQRVNYYAWQSHDARCIPAFVLLHSFQYFLLDFFPPGSFQIKHRFYLCLWFSLPLPSFSFPSILSLSHPSSLCLISSFVPLEWLQMSTKPWRRWLGVWENKIGGKSINECSRPSDW